MGLNTHLTRPLRDDMDASFSIRRFSDSPWFFPVVLAATVAGLFFDAVGADCIFAFRDSLHFYPPLYRLVADEWLAGRVPLWNPLANCGQPLAGMGTAGAFYPPQLLLTMLLPDGVSLNVYCILHLAFAATGAYLVGRYQGCSRPAATVAGLVYAFSGSVLLQIYNPVFAAGAAWLVWAVYGGMRLLDGGCIRDFLLLAAALAMSVFAGDPQSAYHAGLVLGLWWLMQPGRSWRGLGLLAAAGLAGGLLCYVQIALAGEFARESTRASELAPFSIWDVPRFLARPAEARQGVQWYDVFIGRPPGGADHYHAMYRFPVEAYRFGELLWPGLSGPSMARWPVQAGFARADWWTASIYCGMFSVISAMVAVIARPIAPRSRAWMAIAVLAMLASCGQIGPGAIVRWCGELLSGAGLTLEYRPGDEVGGLYWLMASGLPGYAGFRYPAKWMTVAMLAVGQFSGHMVDSIADLADRRRVARFAIGIAVVEGIALLVIALLGVAVGPGSVLPWATPAGGRADAFWWVFSGVAQGLVTASCLAATLWGRWSWSPRLCAVVILVACDLMVAGRRELLVAPWSAVVEASSYLHGIQAGRRPEMIASGERVRVQRSQAASQASPLAADSTSQAASLLDDVVQSGLMAAGHLPWLHGCQLIGDPGTAMDRDFDALRVRKSVGDNPVSPRRFLDSSGVEFFLLLNVREDVEKNSSLTHTWSDEQLDGQYQGISPGGAAMPFVAIPGDECTANTPLMRVYRNESALPRARIVHEVAAVAPVVPAQRDRWLGLLERVAFPTPDMPDLRRAAIVEVPPGAGPLFPPGVPGAAVPAADACRLIVDEPQRVVVEASLSSPGLLYLADTFHRDWTATVATAGGPPRPAPILRANRVHRGVGLPAGRHRVEFRYASRTFGRAAPITAAAWCIAAVGLGWSLRRRRRAGPEERAA